MTDQLAYSHRQFVRAVNLGAFLGWSAILLPIVTGGNLGLTISAAIVGLPIAFLSCWLIGTPILRRAMRTEIGIVGAALWGALIALFMSAAGFLFGRLFDWILSSNPGFTSQAGGGENVIKVNGVLTAYGWQVVATNFAIFVAMGAVIGILTRWLVGPPRP